MHTIDAPMLTVCQADNVFPHDDDLNPINPPGEIAHCCLEGVLGRTVDPAIVEWKLVTMDDAMNYKNGKDDEDGTECARAIVGDTTVIWWYLC